MQDAAGSIIATEAQVTFCGHIHQPTLYSRSAAAKLTSFVPRSGVGVQLLPGRRWLAVLGSVGQPRDGDPAASFAMFDTDTREITYCRVPYDVETAAERIRKNGLPFWLADRLLVGRQAVARPSVQPGAVIDGFTIGEGIHHGGMAALWSVRHPGI